ncbi:MAG: hypothetical protein M3Y56_13440, partial [Armatimonadota bacterium]|nr:hypothetical protein [Armatimonadota bacterium]
SMLMVAAAAAIVMSIVDLFMTATGLGMPPVLAYAGAHSAQFAAALLSAIHFGTLIFVPFKILYCFCLFRHLQSDRVKRTMKL